MRKITILFSVISLSLASCGEPPMPPVGMTAPANISSTQMAQPTSTTIPTPTPAVNQTTHGQIGRDEIWRGEIHILGDIIVDQGVTLTIEPGTVVYIAANQDMENLFDESFNMKIGIKNEANNINGVHMGEPYRDEGHHISIRIEGKLQAVGTPEQLITITSDTPTPGIYDWNYLEFAHGILSYSVVEYYRVIVPHNGTEVSHNILQHIGECGVCANSSVVVEYNTISYAGHELIDMHQSSPTIRNNSLGPNPDHAGIVIDGGSPQILNNTIIGCGAGIHFISPPENPTLEGNIFKNNGQDIIYND
jgi:parallel beta-helix repeat protein